MNTIPSIFNIKQINRTILGGTEIPNNKTMEVSVIVLIRNGVQYRQRVFENISRCGFGEIICIEQKKTNNNSEQLTRKFPFIKYIITLENVTEGEMVNIGMSESKFNYVLVIQDDMCFDEIFFNKDIAERLISLNRFCVIPKLYTSSMQIIPTIFTPGVHKSVFECLQDDVIQECSNTLYAYDWTGFYDKEKYIRLGGADYSITSSYWQLMDLCLRAWLWGESIIYSSSFHFNYGTDLPEEDQTVDKSYMSFYLKNLLPVYKSDHAQIPSSSFFVFKASSSYGLAEAIKKFNEAKKWTATNKYRFKTDASTLIESWGKQ